MNPPPMNRGGGRAAGDRPGSFKIKREPGYYWVLVKGSSGPVVGRFIDENWVGVTPWRIDGRWYADRDISVLSERLLPPEEPAAA